MIKLESKEGNIPIPIVPIPSTSSSTTVTHNRTTKSIFKTKLNIFNNVLGRNKINTHAPQRSVLKTTSSSSTLTQNSSKRRKLSHVKAIIGLDKSNPM